MANFFPAHTSLCISGMFQKSACVCMRVCVWVSESELLCTIQRVRGAGHISSYTQCAQFSSQHTHTHTQRQTHTICTTNNSNEDQDGMKLNVYNILEYCVRFPTSTRRRRCRRRGGVVVVFIQHLICSVKWRERDIGEPWRFVSHAQKEMCVFIIQEM